MTKRQKKKKAKNFLNFNFAVIIIALLVVGSSVKAVASSGSFEDKVVAAVANQLVGKFMPSGPAAIIGSAEMPDCDSTGHLTGCPTTVGDFYAEGAMEVNGIVYADASITAATGLTVTAGDTNLDNLVYGGATTTWTVSTTIATGNFFTAAQICDQAYIPIALGNTTTAALTLPNTTTLFADCLGTDGDMKEVVLRNTETASSSIILIGGGGTLHNASTSAYLLAGDTAEIKIIRDTATAYRAIMTAQEN